MTTTIRIATDFSKFPGPRYRRLGRYSGEEFREKFLVPLFEKGNDGDQIIVILDGTKGYPVSFLDEAFAGLVRLGRFDPDAIARRIKIRYENPAYEPFAISARKLLNEAVDMAKKNPERAAT